MKKQYPVVYIVPICSNINNPNHFYQKKQVQTNLHRPKVFYFKAGKIFR